MKRAAEILWRPLVLASPLIPLLLYFQGAWYGLTEPYSLSMFLGICAYIYFLDALILSTRMKFLDRIAGHDRVIVFHRHLAVSSLILALLHGIIKSLVFPAWILPAPLGIASLAIALVIGAAAILFLKNSPLKTGKVKVPDYNRVKRIHNFMVMSAALAALHVSYASTTSEQWSRTILMFLWGVLALGLWAHHKILKPFLLTKRGQRVSDISSSGDGFITITISKENFPSYRAGQFAYLRFPGSPAGNEEHPFTLSSAPGEQELAITVKPAGDYTSRIKKLEPGMAVEMDGPYGRFTPDQKSTSPLVFIAGGIGITPFRSFLVEFLPEMIVPITLLWSVHDEKDLIYDDLFRSFEKYANFRYHPLITGGKKRIDAGILRSVLGKGFLSDIQWYCCGPTGLTDSVKEILRDKGIKRASIVTERFAF